MRSVMGEDAAAGAGDHATDRHRRNLHCRDVDARALRRDLVLAHRAQNRAGARLVHPPQRDDDQRYHRPDEQHDFERAPAVLREIANLPETLAAERPDADVALGDLVIEVEEEQPHRLAEGDGGDNQHQALDPQRREADGAGDRSGDEGGGEERRDQRPFGEHRQHCRDIGADREEPGLGKTHLAGEQHAVGGEAE